MSLLFFIIATHALWPRPSKSEFGSWSSNLEFSKIEFRTPNEAPSFLIEAFERFSKFYNFESDREQETTTFTCTYTTVDEEFQLETKESYQLSTDVTDFISLNLMFTSDAKGELSWPFNLKYAYQDFRNFPTLRN